MSLIAYIDDTKDPQGVITQYRWNSSYPSAEVSSKIQEIARKREDFAAAIILGPPKFQEGQFVTGSTFLQWELLKEDLKKIKNLNVEFEDRDHTMIFWSTMQQLVISFARAGLGQGFKHLFLKEKELPNLTFVGISNFPFSYHQYESDQVNQIKKENFLEKANAFFTTRKLQSVSLNHFEDRRFSHDTLIESLLEEYQGICIGENHIHYSPKVFLIEKMELLKRLGVTTLFLESVMYDTDQKVLDEYFHSADSAPFPLLYDSYLIEIIQVAKRNGIRVVGIGTTLSLCTIKKHEEKKDLTERLQTMNFSAVQIIEKEKGEGKFVAYMGLCHLGNRYLNVPGISQLLGCPNLAISDTQRQSELRLYEDAEINWGMRYTGFILNIPINPSYKEKWGPITSDYF